MTRRGLKPHQALLVGKLYLHEQVGEIYLGIEVWCPYCKRAHNHSFDEPPFVADHVTHRSPNCEAGSPLRDTGYYIGMDPAHAEHNRAMIARRHAAGPVLLEAAPTTL